jgi:hypothetical protein
MRLNNFSGREKIVAAVTASLVAAALVFSLIIEPVSRARGRLDRDIAVAESALAKDTRLLAAYKSSGRNTAAVTTLGVRGGSTVEEETAALLEWIEEISRNASCSITSIKPLGAKAFGPYKDVSVEIVVEGSIAQLANLMYEAERSADMPIRIRRFSISAKSSSGGALRGSFLVSRFI